MSRTNKSIVEDRLPRRANLETWAVVALIAVPGSASLKAAGIIFYFFYGLLSNKLTRYGVLMTCSVLGFLGIWLLIAFLNGTTPHDSIDQAARIAIFFSLFACAYFARHTFRGAASIDRVCLRTAYVAALIKIAIIGVVVGLNVPLQDVLDALGFESVSESIGFNLQRLQFPSDFVITFLVACYVGGRSRFTDALFGLAIAVVVFLSFSRFIFACFAVGLVVRSLWTARVDFLPKVALVLALGVSAVFVDTLVERFVGESSEASDDVRVEQSGMLAEQIQLKPVMGHGLGASVPNYFRSDSLPYSYEMQWYATVMQLGYLGSLIFLGNVFFVTFRPVRSLRPAICMAFLTLVWMASGLTNPFLTSLGSGVGLAMLGWRSKMDVVRARAQRRRLISSASAPKRRGSSGRLGAVAHRTVRNSQV